MKIPFLFAISGFLILLLPGCKSSHAYTKYVKELDSLKVVVEQAIDNFKTIDSLECYKAIVKLNTYRSFISSHVKDTVSSSAAIAMQQFFATEKPLNDYLVMRPLWLAEARTRVMQLHNLSTDLKNDAIETSEAIDFINNEKRASEKIIEELKVNTTLLRKHMETYTQQLAVVENVMKERNVGKLPELVAPEKKAN